MLFALILFVFVGVGTGCYRLVWSFSGGLVKADVSLYISQGTLIANPFCKRDNLAG